MARLLWEVFRSLFGGDDEEEEESGFRPSPMDLSVRFAHGGPDSEVDREIHEINEQARQLEEQRPD
ncbi:hypothetical protein [Natranaeroarchaeum sulfidigenes]|uniref:Uncharacterized protein n=1 Tax=Natranaeroarchaeum sulfidigenes TaxID=2784880 RepID=A0A897MLL7_9EURY|nr:hypothetical protein [Natranaeroarchaeum sulfidigenes]QSG01504.1 hypothetical protein AArcS_0269 [Natranaeroarchaeum sulfidigenes]